MPEAGLCKPLQTAPNLCCLPSPATLMPEAALCRWENPLIGWTSTADPVDTVARSGLEFGSREAAIAFADKHGCALASGWTSIAVLGRRQGLPSSPLLGGMLKHSNVLHLASAPTQHVQRSIYLC